MIDRKPLIDANSEEGTKPTEVKGDIQFHDVKFRYPSRPDAPVFTKLNMHVPGGKRVALVGESGSGKSTCIAMIERYYDPVAGKVTLDGQDLKQINVRHLRSLIGLVSQEPILFGTTIRENVRFGRPDATDAEVEQACKDANAHGFITGFPDSYNTFVTSSLVSGGQKQRLAIARALLRNPPILLLDEATAALDNESERLVNEAIDRLLSASGSRTTIVIAHRLSSIRACEKIIVLEKGQVVEEGDHDALIAHNGLYASLFKLSEGTGKLVDTKKTKSSSEDKSAEKKKTVAAGTTKASTSDEDEESHGVKGGDAHKVVELRPEHSETSTSAEDHTDGTKTGREETTGCCGRKKKVSDGGKKKEKKKRYPIRKAFKYAYPERFVFIPAIIAAGANGLTFPLFALLFANLLETFFFPNSSQILSSATTWCLAFFGLAIGNGLAVFFQEVLFSYINGKMTKRVRSSVFHHILSQDMGFYDEKTNNVGALSSKLASDAAMVKAAISDRLAQGTMNLSTMAAGFIIAFVASWQLSLVVFAIFPAMAIAGAIEMMVMGGAAMGDQKAFENAASTMSEAVNGVRTVAAFNMQGSIIALYKEQLKGPLNKAVKRSMAAGLGFGFSQGMMYFAYALTLWYGSRLVADGTISFKDLNQSMFGILMTAMAFGQNIVSFSRSHLHCFFRRD